MCLVVLAFVIYAMHSASFSDILEFGNMCVKVSRVMDNELVKMTSLPKARTVMTPPLALPIEEVCQPGLDTALS